MAADKFQGTCSICLRAMQLHGDNPIRHGFKAVGVKHGSHGGWHTGPCPGSNFPHLGISNEGTLWALKDARSKLEGVEDGLRKLDEHPDLTWYRPARTFVVRGALPEQRPPVVLRYDEQAAAWNADGRPTYDSEHRRRVAELTNLKDRIESAIANYERVLATWKPQAAGAAPMKIETVHMTMPRTNNRGDTWDGISCRFTKSGYASAGIAKTTDTTKVTCKRCKSMLGLPT